jgi:putative NADH-flavin reductase
MIITVFGAAGKVGKRIVLTALAEGNKVISFVRNAEPYLDEGLRNENFTVRKGYVFDAHEVFDAIKGSDAVLSTLGGAANGTDKTRSLGIKNIIEQMHNAGVKRIITVGGSGVLKDDNFGFAVHNPKYPALYKDVAMEHLKAYEYLSATNLDWTFVCCPDITDKDANGKYITNEDYAPVPNLYTIKAGNVAQFMLNELKNKRYLQKRVGISDM